MIAMSPRDRTRRSRVPRSVPRLATALFACVLAAGCGGKDKQPTTTPSGAAGPGQAGDPADMDPEGGYQPGDSDVVGGGGQPGDPGEPGAEPGEPGAEPGEPAIRPPGVDLSPEQQRKVVSQHVRAGRAALRGASPDPDAAIAEAEAALQADETSVDAMIILAHANVIKGYHDLAEDILGKALERGGQQNKQAHFLLGLVYEHTDREDQAPAEYQAALAIDPSYTSALMNLGVHHLANKRYEEALRVYERLTSQLGVNTPAAWTNLASAHRGRSADFALTDAARRRQHILEAEKNYRRAISLDKNYSHAYYNLGILYLDAEPFPDRDGEMDRLARLKRAKTYFDEYRRLAGADQKLVDQTSAVAQKLIDREQLLRKKQAEREAKRKAAEERRKKQGDELGDDGFE